MHLTFLITINTIHLLMKRNEEVKCCKLQNTVVSVSLVSSAMILYVT